MVAPQARGLFRRAIVQSAGWALQGAPAKADQEGLALALQSALLGDGGGIEALRALPAATVFEAAQEVYAGHFFDPVIDGESLLEPVVDSVLAGRFTPVDLLIGSNADEWRMYLAEDADLDDWVSEGLPPDARPAAEPLLAETPDPRRALDRAVTARQMVCPSLALAEAVARGGGRSWVYYFTRQRPGEKAADMGAYHGAELPYLFDSHDAWLPTAPADRVLTRKLMGYWARFARTGDPNPAPGAVGSAGTVPLWPAYRGGGADVLRLDMDLRPVHHPDWPLCAVLGVGATEGP
jgi:para-nitrobenzyl esterase